MSQPAVSALLSAALLLLVGPASVATPSRRPNIVVIMLDDQRWDTADGTHGLNGAPVLPGVVQDLAAVEGITFTNAYVTTALCAPSRTSFLSGQYAHTHGIRTNERAAFWEQQHGVLEPDLLPVWLEEAGYRTALVGKYSNAYKNFDAQHPEYVPPGWTDWHAFSGQGQYANFTLCESEDGSPVDCQPNQPGYSTYVLRDRAVAFIEKATQPFETKPFFLLYTPKAVHGEGGNGLPQPECADIGTFSAIPDWRPSHHNEPDFTDKPLWLRDQVSALSTAAQDHLDTVRQRALETSHAVAGPSPAPPLPSPLPSPLPPGCVPGADRTRAIEAILDTLRDRHVDRDTVVIFTSDNGYFWGEHRLNAKTLPYEEAIRVPLVIRPAGGTTPRTESSLVLNIDLTATIADLADALPLLAQEGRSLAPFLDGVPPNPAWRDHFLIEAWDENDGTPAFAGVKSAVDGKYVEYLNGDKEYYTVADVREEQNVIANPPDPQAVTRLTQQLLALRPSLPTEPRDTIFASSFELGNLSRWSVAPAHPDLTVAHEAALIGDPETAFGLKVVVQNDVALSVQDNTPQDEPQYRAKFTFDPNGLDPGMSPGGQSEITLFFAGEEPSRRQVTIVLQRVDGDYKLVSRVRDAGGSTVDFGPYDITDAPHRVEFEWRKAGDALPPHDGYFKIWIDGAVKGTSNAIDTGDHGVDFARLGAISLHAGATGTLYIDGFVSRRQFSQGE